MRSRTPISRTSRANVATDDQPYCAEGQLAFTQEEWDAAMPTQRVQTTAVPPSWYP
jgi:hypothetical protein